MPERLLIADEMSDLFVDDLRSSFPEMEIMACQTTNALTSALASFEPTIAYSCVSHKFPRHLHSPLIQCPTLRWLHVGGSGFDHFKDYDPNQISLTNGRGVLAPFLADTVMGALIALNHGFFDFHRDQKQGRYAARTHPALLAKTLVVIGPGAIGQALAKRADVFGMKCIAIARTPQKTEPFSEVHGFEHLSKWLAKADFVSLHVPLSETTRGLIGARELDQMRESSILINCARGGVVDQPALIDALAKHSIRAAYLDVFEEEPLNADHPLRHAPNLFMTPHCSDQVDDWQYRHAMFFKDNLARWLKGEPLENRIAA